MLFSLLSLRRSLRLGLLLAVVLGPSFVPIDAQAPKQFTAEEYIEQWKAVAIKKMKEHGIPASITLAQGLLESGNGNSVLARESNNHFGIKCTSDWTGGRAYHDDDKKDDCFRVYKDASDSYEDHAKFLQKPRYASLFELKSTDYKGWAHGLKKAGYATDPHYPQKLIDLIERYNLHNLDEGVDVSYKPKPAQKDEPRQSHRSSRRSTGGEEIVIGAGREVERFEDRIKFVRAKDGDTFRKLADELEMTHGMLARWNDMDPNAALTDGQVVYIQPKRNNSKSTEVHVAEQGETLWGVSQRYGVKLNKLAKYNDLPIATQLQAGQKVL
ncbi:MAG TPA: glucosaminidase domain-containing protein, partial [Flavobacteriales bacterium]|nr:glucosaminidase domain-containing protein [Flavobacteriales bacterium]